MLTERLEIDETLAASDRGETVPRQGRDLIALLRELALKACDLTIARALLEETPRARDEDEKAADKPGDKTAKAGDKKDDKSAKKDDKKDDKKDEKKDDSAADQGAVDPAVIGTADDYQLARAVDMLRGIALFNGRLVN